MRFTIVWDAVKKFEQIQKFTLDTEQANVRKQIHDSSLILFFIHALVGVGKDLADPHAIV